MKIHIKLEELVNILIDKRRSALLEKYNLDKDALDRVVASIKEGKWKFIS